MERTVHVVHCIDTEGPLHESLEATFERLKEIFGLSLEPTEENLRRLQRREVDLNGMEEEVYRVVDPHQLNYSDTWDRIDRILSEIMSPGYRDSFPDSFGNGWIFNWHCVDHVGYDYNPRRRDIGYHNIFDHYAGMIRWTGSGEDAIHFHYHPMPFNRKAHHCATHYFAHSHTLFQVLARRVLERHWFPSVNRAGFHTLRPDSHWFLEQFIPFDFSSQASDEDYEDQKDLSGGRFGDWRRAPRTWEPYHPSHDDYQVKGSCRRWIARCLNVGMRVRILSQEDVDQAFREAEEGRPVVLSFADLDYRDMRVDIRYVRDLIRSAAERFPDVSFRFCEARDAMRRALRLPAQDPCRITLELEGNLLTIRSGSPTFGPQPFFALKTRSGDFFYDNLDIQEPFRQWTYTFDEQTFPTTALEKVGIGTCDRTGNVTTAVMDVVSGAVTTTCR
jgi:hypothetical protein